jgi:hypothetical protein
LIIISYFFDLRVWGLQLLLLTILDSFSDGWLEAMGPWTIMGLILNFKTAIASV